MTDESQPSFSTHSLCFFSLITYHKTRSSWHISCLGIQRRWREGPFCYDITCSDVGKARISSGRNLNCWWRKSAWVSLLECKDGWFQWAPFSICKFVHCRRDSGISCPPYGWHSSRSVKLSAKTAAAILTWVDFCRLHQVSAMTASLFRGLKSSWNWHSLLQVLEILKSWRWTFKFLYMFLLLPSLLCCLGEN